jgi:hypothetical protein
MTKTKKANKEKVKSHMYKSFFIFNLFLISLFFSSFGFATFGLTSVNTTETPAINHFPELLNFPIFLNKSSDYLSSMRMFQYDDNLYLMLGVASAGSLHIEGYIYNKSLRVFELYPSLNIYSFFIGNTGGFDIFKLHPESNDTNIYLLGATNLGITAGWVLNTTNANSLNWVLNTTIKNGLPADLGTGGLILVTKSNHSSYNSGASTTVFNYGTSNGRNSFCLNEVTYTWVQCLTFRNGLTEGSYINKVNLIYNNITYFMELRAGSIKPLYLNYVSSTPWLSDEIFFYNPGIINTVFSLAGPQNFPYVNGYFYINGVPNCLDCTIPILNETYDKNYLNESISLIIFGGQFFNGVNTKINAIRADYYKPTLNLTGHFKTSFNNETNETVINTTFTDSFVIYINSSSYKEKKLYINDVYINSSEFFFLNNFIDEIVMPITKPLNFPTFFYISTNHLNEGENNITISINDSFGFYNEETIFINYTQLSTNGMVLNFDWVAESSLNIGTCPTTPHSLFNLWVTIIILIVLGLYASTNGNKGLGYLSGFGLIFSTLFVWGCSWLIGGLIAILGIAFLLITNSMGE